MIKYTKNATIVRAQAMYGKRLKQNDYRELAGKKSVSEVADYLKRNTHYSSALSTINPLTIHRGHLESILRRYSFERYISLCDFQQLRKEKFYNYLLVLSEIREILSVILHINAGNSDEYISSLPSYLVSKTSFVASKKSFFSKILPLFFNFLKLFFNNYYVEKKSTKFLLKRKF